MEHGIEEAVNPVVAAQRVRDADVAGDDGPQCQYHQRDGHRGRSVVGRSVVGIVAMVGIVGGGA